MFLKKSSPTLALLILLGSSLAIAGCYEKNTPSLEERAISIDKKLICPVCPGETIDQSQVEIAKQMRAIVREKLAQGESEEEILNFFLQRYGPFVLAQPPKSGFNLTAWLVPPTALIIGGGVLFFVIKAMRKSTATIPIEKVAQKEQDLEEYLSRVDEEMKSLE